MSSLPPILLNAPKNPDRVLAPFILGAHLRGLRQWYYDALCIMLPEKYLKCLNFPPADNASTYEFHTANYYLGTLCPPF